MVFRSSSIFLMREDPTTFTNSSCMLKHFKSHNRWSKSRCHRSRWTVYIQLSSMWLLYNQNQLEPGNHQVCSEPKLPCAWVKLVSPMALSWL